jgi:hypothetical protein
MSEADDLKRTQDYYAHKRQSEIDDALAVLKKHGYATPEAERIVLATEKGLTPIGECIASLEAFTTMRTDAPRFVEAFTLAVVRAERAISNAFSKPQPQKSDE